MEQEGPRRVVLLNAFSPAMIPKKGAAMVEFVEVPEYVFILNLKEVHYTTTPIVSYLGHPGIVEYLEKRGIPEAVLNRAEYTLTEGDELFIVVAGRRLEPGEEVSAETLKPRFFQCHIEGIGTSTAY